MNHPEQSVVRNCAFLFSIIVITALLSVRLLSHAQDYAPAIQRFLAVQGDYEKLRDYSLHAKVAHEIRNILPPGACLETSLPKDDVTLNAIVLKYYLYPLKVADNWPSLFNQRPPSCQGHFYIDFNGTFNAAKNNKHDFRVSHGVKIFALDHSSIFLENKPPLYPRLRIFLGFIGFNLWILLVGALIWWILPVRRNLMGMGGFLSASFLLGFISITLLFWLLLLMGFVLSKNIIILVFSVATIGGLITLTTKHVSFRLTEIRTLAKIHPSAIYKKIKESTNGSRVDFLIALAGLLVIAFFVLITIAIPINVWDEMHIWLLKSKIYFINRTLDFDYTVYTNNYYPIVWSLNIAAQYCFIGGMYDELAKWTSAVVFVSFVGMLFQVAVYMGLVRRFAWLTVLIFLAGFPHWTMFTALTENIYIAFLCLALFFALHYFVGKEKSCCVFVWLALLGTSTVKFEGASIALFLVLAYLFSGQGRSKGELVSDLKLTIPFLAFLFIPALWQMWLQIHHIPFSIYHFQAGFSPENLFLTLIMSGFTIFSKNNLLVTGIVFIPLLVLSRKKTWSRPERFVLIFCIFLTIFSLTAGLCWPKQELISYYPEVLSRLFSRVTPFLILLWASRTLNAGDSRTA